MNDAATPATATASETHDLNSAARAIEKIIRREKPASPPNLPAAGDRAEAISADGDPTQPPDDDDGAADPEDDADGEEGWAPDDHDDDEDDNRAQESDARFAVKIDGKTEEIGVKELIKGYQRNADYTRKTMRLADERREVEEARARLDGELAVAEQQRRHYGERLDRLAPNLRQQLSQFDGIDWTRLSAENPTLYAQARPIHDTLAAQLRQT